MPRKNRVNLDPEQYHESAREAGLRGARLRWGPPIRLSLRGLPAPQREAVAALVESLKNASQ